MPKTKTIIVCESNKNGTDIQLLEKLIKNHSLLPRDKYLIEAKGSIDDVKKFFQLTLSKQTYIISSDIKNILVIVDADEKPRQRFLEIKHCFNTQNYATQRSLDAQLPNDSTKINVGIYLFPDNKSRGSLETLGLKTLNHSQLALKLKCIDSYIKCLNDKDCSITVNNISKAKFRIFMATPDPDRYVDSIINSLNFNSSEFIKLRDFIKQAQ